MQNSFEKRLAPQADFSRRLERLHLLFHSSLALRRPRFRLGKSLDEGGLPIPTALVAVDNRGTGKSSRQS